MPYIYAILGFIAFALAFPIPKHNVHIIVTPLHQPTTIFTALALASPVSQYPPQSAVTPPHQPCTFSTVLAPASPISKYSPHIVVTALLQSSFVETVQGIVSGRGLIAAPQVTAFPASSNAISILSTNTTAHSPAPSTSPTQPSFSLPQQSPWGPGAISNIFFGCVATFLGAIPIGLTYYLYRRQSRSQQTGQWTKFYLSIIKLLTVSSIDESVELDDMPVLESPALNDNALPLEDLPPAYTSVDASAGGLGPQDTRSPDTTHL